MCLHVRKVEPNTPVKFVEHSMGKLFDVESDFAYLLKASPTIPKRCRYRIYRQAVFLRQCAWIILSGAQAFH